MERTGFPGEGSSSVAVSVLDILRCRFGRCWLSSRFIWYRRTFQCVPHLQDSSLVATNLPFGVGCICWKKGAVNRGTHTINLREIDEKGSQDYTEETIIHGRQQ